MLGLEIFDEGLHRRLANRLGLPMTEFVPTLVNVAEQVGNGHKSVIAEIVEIGCAEEYPVQIEETASDSGIAFELVVQNALRELAHRRTVKPLNAGLKVPPELPRVCRRPFGLSYAAMAGCSSMA